MCRYRMWGVLVCLLCVSAAAEEPVARPTLTCFKQPPIDELVLKWETLRCKWIALPGLTVKQDDASVETVAEHVYISKGRVYRYNVARKRLEALVVSNDDGSAAPIIALEATVIPEATPSTRSIVFVAAVDGGYGRGGFDVEDKCVTYCKDVDVRPESAAFVKRYLEHLSK